MPGGARQAGSTRARGNTQKVRSRSAPLVRAVSAAQKLEKQLRSRWSRYNHGTMDPTGRTTLYDCRAEVSCDVSNNMSKLHPAAMLES